MSRPWESKILYGAYLATELLLTWPTPPWDIADEGIGGSDTSAAGIPEAYEVRRDYIMSLRLPFWESQYAAVEAWLRWAQKSGQSFEFWFDRANATTAFDVYLHAPLLDAGFRPERDPALSLFWLPVSLRTADALPFTVSWSGE